MKDVATIAVPTFENKTLEPRIEVLVTDTVIKQIQQDGTYQVRSEETADAILEGKISEMTRRPARSVRGNVLATQEFILYLTLDYKVTKRETGEVLERRRVTGSTNFFVSADLQQDERQAVSLAAEQAAIRLVSLLSEGW